MTDRQNRRRRHRRHKLSTAFNRCCWVSRVELPPHDGPVHFSDFGVASDPVIVGELRSIAGAWHHDPATVVTVDFYETPFGRVTTKMVRNPRYRQPPTN